jgi:hypothetical protein
VFNPLDHRGIPLDDQIRDWRELNVTPVDPEAVDPYTRCRIITMNGIETASALEPTLDYEQVAGHRHPFDEPRTPYDRDSADPRSKLNALTILSAEQQHVTRYESLIDPGESWWEQLLTHEYQIQTGGPHPVQRLRVEAHHA